MRRDPAEPRTVTDLPPTTKFLQSNSTLNHQPAPCALEARTSRSSAGTEHMRDGLRDMRVVAVIFIQLVVIVGRSASPPVPGPLLPVKVVGLRGVREGAEPGSILSEGQGVPLASDVRTWYAAIPSNGGSWYADIEANKVRPRRRRSRNVVDTDRELSRAFRRRWSGGPWGVFKCLGNSSRTGGDCPGNVTYGIAELSGESWKMLLCERCSVGMPDAVYLRRRCMVCPREASFGNPGTVTAQPL